MADVQPLEAIRYAPHVDLARAVCPPFDTISPLEQRRLYDVSPDNAVRLELPTDSDPYRAAAKTLSRWLDKGTLVREETPAFWAYRQEFPYRGETFRRRLLFARLRLEPWESGVVLPHERTFSAPKEDRLKLLHSLRLNTSPVFLVYTDSHKQVAPLVARSFASEPAARFRDAEGCSHGLWRMDDPHVVAALARAFQGEKLYVADGHHRYETALTYQRETGREDGPESFVLVALAAVDDPGLLVLPIHRIVNGGAPLEKALRRLVSMFEVEARPSLGALLADMAERGRMVSAFGLVSAESPEPFLLTLYDPEGVERHLPKGRSPAWRRLDAAVANHVILRRALGLKASQTEDIGTVWYGEDAEGAEAEVRRGRARYAVLLNPISPKRVIAVADGGERMPQKSTFFYPKIPTGLVFNPLFP